VNHLDIFFDKANPTGSVGDLDMFRLIIGVPVAAGGTVAAPPAISKVDTYNPSLPMVSNTTGWTAISCGSFSSGTNAYAACVNSGGVGNTPSIPSGGNTFGAWHDADNEIGVDPSYFALYYYNLNSVVDLDAMGYYDVFFQSPLAVGTMEIAYGCVTTSAGCPCYFTPFTQAGQTTPEPSSWLLVAGATIGIMLSRFRITWKRKS
jgi:hypothetical protein